VSSSGHARHSRRFADGVARHYDKLSASERFRLALEATARDDVEERERLVNRCPRKMYTMPDHEFLDRIDASRHLALIVGLDLGPRTSKVRMLRGTREALIQSIRVGLELRCEADEDLPSDRQVEWAAGPVADALKAIEEETRTRSASVLAAFGEICRDQMGVEPETVLLANLGPLTVDQLGLEEFEDVEPEPDAVGLWRQLFERRWRDWIQP
jgi:hypothetical protein